MKHAGVLGDRQVWAERELLEDAANAEILGATGRIVLLLRAGMFDAPAAGSNSPRQDVHQVDLPAPLWPTRQRIRPFRR